MNHNHHYFDRHCHQAGWANVTITLIRIDVVEKENHTLMIYTLYNDMHIYPF